MSKTPLAEQFSFNSRTFHAYAGPNGDLLHIAHGTKTIFRRPDRLSVEVTGDDESIKIFYDGKNMVLFSVEQKKYESIRQSVAATTFVVFEPELQLQVVRRLDKEEMTAAKPVDLRHADLTTRRDAGKNRLYRIIAQ